MTNAGYTKYTATTATRTPTGTAPALNATYYLALLAGACDAGGMPSDARVHLDAAIDVAVQSGERWFGPELYRLKGEWLLRHTPGSEDEAKTAFERAIDWATQRNARLWELRAAVSLARLYVARGHPDRARDTLAPVYQWFSEGLDLPDLRQAQALIASLPA
jgi:predicted ATPase